MTPARVSDLYWNFLSAEFALSLTDEELELVYFDVAENCKYVMGARLMAKGLS